MIDNRFFHAQHSRAELNTTREMFSAALTCHQVMPEFLDFVFPFGRQEFSRDFYFSALKVSDRYNNINCAIEIPELGRSGKRYEMCYNLRSAERTSTPHQPWSIRQTAIYHAFDTIYGRTIWISIKGNHLIRDRINDALNTGRDELQGGNDASGSLGQAFLASLEVHLILCNWARENWRWYINFLEDEFQELTSHTLHTLIDRPLIPTSQAQPILRSQTAPTPSTRRRRTLSLSQGRRASRTMTFGAGSPKTSKPSNGDPRQTVISKGAPLPEDPEFAFSKLQNIQHLQEKTNETWLVLTININILQELGRYYTNLRESRHWPDDFREQTTDGIHRFHQVVSEAVSDMEMQKSRLEILRRVLADRKALVSRAHLAMELRGKADARG